MKWTLRQTNRSLFSWYRWGSPPRSTQNLPLFKIMYVAVEFRLGARLLDQNTSKHSSWKMDLEGEMFWCKNSSEIHAPFAASTHFPWTFCRPRCLPSSMARHSWQTLPEGLWGSEWGVWYVILCGMKRETWAGKSIATWTLMRMGQAFSHMSYDAHTPGREPQCEPRAHPGPVLLWVMSDPRAPEEGPLSMFSVLQN